MKSILSLALLVGLGLVGDDLRRQSHVRVERELQQR